MQSIFNATRLSIALRRKARWAALAAAIALPVVFSQTSTQTGGAAVTGGTVGGTYVETTPIPPGAKSAKVSFYDDDSWFYGGDDHLFTGTNPDLGDNKVFTARLEWTCSGGEVRGPAGGTGEQCAEIFAEVTFYDAKGVVVGKATTTTHEVCCPD